ncbi:AraC family transcriptional regulator [Caballeronia concitans]|uniref:AraC family transcriptional regulator n=2 Tax=Caballeronia concitans TaxID=1777133 RepID=A0A658R1Q7_9BURK|nr:transcriptional regulator with aminotransferase type sensor, AraC family [Burkholderia sp. MR1]SAL40420.1 AraC family transcriptional regulator [Caballeronia concitans]
MKRSGRGIGDDAQESERNITVRQIGILAFDGFSLLGTSAISEIFQIANEIQNSRGHCNKPYNVTFYSGKGATVQSSSLIDVWTHACDPSDVQALDAVFIADGPGVQDALQDTRVMDWLSELLSRRKLISPIGNGKALLDIALRDMQVHGELMSAAATERNRFGLLQEEIGRANPSDEALKMVGNDMGEEAAREIAVRIRPVGGDGLSLIFVPTREGAVTEKIRVAAQWIRQNCDQVTSVREAVSVAAMSERNFQRRFKEELGVTPFEYLTQARLDVTSRLLVETPLSIESIARQCGWASGARLSRVFKRCLGVTPTEFRARVASKKMRARS